jgi:protease-4
MQELVEKISPNGASAATGISGQIVRRFEAEMKTLRSFNDPQGLYARLPVEFMIH